MQEKKYRRMNPYNRRRIESSAMIGGSKLI
jgi:hypothetical protein